MKLGAKELRDLPESKKINTALPRLPLYFILDTIYDTYNIGGLFRLADALNIEKMYLCGDMETPPNARIAKASIGTYKIVPWEYKKTTAEAIAQLRSSVSGISIVAVEQNEKSVPFSSFDYKKPLAIIVGNETFGISEEVQALCDATVEIPMYGINKSLNVIVSAAIVSYFAISVEKKIQSVNFG